MAIDLGLSRTGLAVCDKFEMLASPLCVIQEKDMEKLVQKISDHVLLNNVEEIVVGYPKNMDGSIGETAKRAELLVFELEKKMQNISFVLWDERNTTKLASRFLSNTNTYGAKRKKIIDAVAATIILENYMDFKKSNKKNNYKNDIED